MASLTKVKINNIDTSIEYFADPLVLLNFGSTLANTDIGFIFNRDGGTSSNVALYWDETKDRISVAYTSTTGLPNGNIALTSYANVAAAWYFGNLAGGTTNNIFVSANVLPTGNAVYNFGSPTARWNVGYFAATTLDLGGSQISVDPTNGFKFTVGGTGTPTYLASNGLISGTTLSSSGTLNVGTSGVIGTTLGVGTNITAGGYINAAGNILSTGAVHNALTVNGNESVTGYVNVTGNVLATVFNGGQVNVSGLINTAGNVLATAGTFNALTVNGNESVTGYLNVTGNVLASVITASQINTPGNVLATVGVFNGLTVNGVINASGNILSTGAIHNLLTVNGNTTIGVATVAGVVHSIVGNVNQSGAGTVFYNTPGNIMAAIGRFGSISSDGFINTSANISAGQGQFGTINITGLLNSSANISASMFSGGQLYVSGLVNAGGNLLASAGTFSSLDVNGNIEVGSATNPGGSHSFIGNIQQSGPGTVWFNTPGNLLAAYGQFGQIRSDGLINTSANVMAATGRFGTVLSDGFINTSANVSAASYVGGQLVVSGVINTAANILTSQITVFGNAVIGAITTPGVVHNLVGNISQSGAGTIFFNTPGNVMAATGQFGAVNVSGYVNAAGNISTPQLNAGQINTTGNVSASQLIASTLSTRSAYGNIHLTQFASIFAEGNSAENQSIVQVSTTGLSDGAGMWAFTGLDSRVYSSRGIAFATGLTMRGQDTPTGGVIKVAITAAGDLWANAVTTSTSTSTGALVVAGGVGIGGNVIAGGYINTAGNILAAAVTVNALTVNGGVASTGFINTSGNLSAAIGQFGAINSTGYINTTGNISTAQLNAGQINTTGNILATGAVFNSERVNGTSTVNVLNSTGNILATGGIFNSLTVNGNQSVTGYVNITGNIIAVTAKVGSIESSGVIYANSTAIGTSSTTGALQVAGGIGVAKDSYFGGNLTLAGNLFVQGNVTYFSSNNVTFSDALIYLADGATGDVVDIGFVGHYYSPGYQHTGFARDATDGVWKLFANVVAEPTTTIDFTNATYSNLMVGNILAGQATITGLNSAGFINTSGNISAATILAGAITSTGYINTAGNISTAQLNAGQINTTGNVLATTGIFNALNVNGNETITGFLNVTGNILSAGAVHNSLTVNGGITSTGFFNTSGNISAAAYTGGTINVSGVINTAGNILSTGAVHNALTVNGNTTVANITTTGAGQFTGPFNESTTISGVYAGNLNLSPRVGFFNGTAAQNWQIDNNFGTFRWYTPGVTRMSLDPNGNLSVSGTANVTYTGSGESALQITGYASRGGVGYHDFLRVTNTYASATNPNKFFRVDSAGTLQIINSAYTANPLSLTDDGRFSVSGNITAGTLTTPGAQHTFFGNVQTNAIGFLQVPAGTTLQRPITGNVAGMIRFNLDTNSFEGYGNAWAAIGGGGGGGSTPGGVTSTIQYNAGGALGGIASMNYVVANGAVILSTGTSSTSTATGALQIIGGVGITENINTGGSITTTGLINTSANVSASQVSAGTIKTTGVVNSGGNVVATGGVFNALNVNGNIAVGLLTTPGAGHTITGNVVQSGAGTVYINTPGNIIAAQGSFGTVNATGLINTAGNVVAAVITASQFNTAGNILSAGAVHNALAVNGTATVSILNSTGNILGTGGILNSLTVNGTATVSILNSTGNILSTGAVHNSLTVNGATTQAGTLTVSSGFLNCAGNIVSTGAIHNALTVNGGITSSGYLNTSGNISAAIGSFGTLIVGSTTTVTNLSADTLDGIHAIGLYNNMGDNHATRTAFDAAGVALTTNFGYRYVQGATNGPGTNSATQYYSWNIGLGNDYAYNTYAAQFALPRNVSTPYLSVRYEEAGVLGAWQKIAAGSADTAAACSGTAYLASAVSYLPNRTDATAYPVLWGAAYTSGSGTIAYSCAAITITSSTGTLTATLFAGKATSAQYADLAENYTSDKKYVAGTVVIFGGDKEVTISTESHDPAIAGIISSNPAYLMNSELDGLPVALQGRVPCRVQGPVKKGDRLVSSSKSGVACKMDKALYEPGCIIGKALEDILDDRVVTIEVVVGRV